uniref:hypothetical protein n=1 Tax=Agathobacter sp. TaxID=2021311 RepID=UPI0040565609
MKKYVWAYVPFLIYFAIVILLYFIFFYVLPKYTALMALIGFFFIYAYMYIGIPILGYVVGKMVVKRMPNDSFFVCMVYAMITFGLMILASSMKYVFWDCMYFNYPFSFSIFVERMTHNDNMYVSFGSLLSFAIGEIV